MRTKYWLSLLLLFILASNVIYSQRIKYVNPFIGTGSMGHVFPGAVSPHGLVALSPDTDTIPHNVNGVYQKRAYEYCAGYQHKDSTIVGFSHTHMSGTGHSDLGDILVMPTNGPLKLNPGTANNVNSGYRSIFSHSKEIASPGYYSVFLDKYKITAELTTSPRVGIHRYTFPKDRPDNRIIIDLIHGIYNYDGKVLWSSVRVENERLLTGYRITSGWARENYQYFAIEFSKPIVKYGYKDKEKKKYTGFWRKFNQFENFPEMAGQGICAYFEFGNIDSLTIKVALSAVSTRGALENLRHETNGKYFDQIRKESEDEWEKRLGRIDVKGDSLQKVMFYTSLYHTMINPSKYQDINGEYRGLDGNIYKATNFTNYTIFSLWDTYRALHPLFNIINREVNRDAVLSMIEHSKQSVHKILPIWSHMANENWCMIGYHGVSVLSDAIAAGIDLDKEQALKSMVSSSNFVLYDNIGDYKKLGYVPFDKNKSGASITLEYSYDDWAIYQTALRANNIPLSTEYKSRAKNYSILYHPITGFCTPKFADGSWKKDFSPLNTHNEGFIEGNSWNYSFYVPHDVDGLISKTGGDTKFIQRLDSLFTMHLPDEFFEHTEDVTKEGIMGNYVHGNEPSHHIPYLYSWTTQPWKSQFWIREIMNKKYMPTVEGLCGNDDCGQMSAWYIFSAMGFYPVSPGSGELILGAPYLPELIINLENGAKFTIKAMGVSDKIRYVKSVKFNGIQYNKAYIRYEDILKGGVLEFEMVDKPNKKRLFRNDERPYSLSSSKD